MSRRHDIRRVRDTWPYTRKELAETLNVRTTTISRWTSQGLKTVDNGRPILFRGPDVKEFLAARAKPRQPLSPGQLFCTPCKQPRSPADKRLHLIPRSPTTVDFNGPCSV